MPDFISKLQYKNYERGEFCDEKVRTLDETIQLIKVFPWSEQRGVDIQLTAPSVTIQDENFNYLKLAIYFNGKYCLYYLDNSGHLYEYHTESLDKAIDIITLFFDGLINLELFEKHLLSGNAKKHFENGVFDYSLNKVTMFFNLLLMPLFLIIMIAVTVTTFKVSSIPGILIIFYLLFDILFLATFWFMIKMYLRTKDTVLTISSGKDEFQLLDNDELTIYNKANIAQVNVFGKTSKSSKIFIISEIEFTDGSKVMIPGSLIDIFTLVGKFPGRVIAYKGGYYLTSPVFWKYFK